MENTPQISTSGIMALLMGYLLVIGIIMVFVIICEWRIFTKAGKPGWACLIPIYNLIVFLEIIGKPWWHMFLLLIPFYNIYLGIKYVNLFSKSYGQGVGFTIGLLFLNVIFMAIMAFSSSIKYVGPAGAPAPVPAS